MSRQTLKDANFKIIGYIDTAPDGKQTGRNSDFQVVGYYDPHRDITKDASFHTIGDGNLLAALVFRR